MNTRLIVGLLFPTLFFVSTMGQGNAQEKPLKVLAIYPAGEEVPTSEPITIQFNQNIVTLGASSVFVDDVVPVEIEPAIECEWNWVKLNTLQCELLADSNFEYSTKYTVTVRPGIKAPKGQMMNEEFVHSFGTTVPSMEFHRIVSWKSPTEPIIWAEFNQVVQIDSLRERIFLIDSVSGKEMSTKVCPTDGRLVSKFKDDFFGRKEEYGVFEGKNCGLSTKYSDSVLILPNEPLAANAKVSMLVLPGVKGAAGNLLSKEQELVETDVTTFGEFRFLGLVCQDERGREKFIPVDESQEQSCSMHFPIFGHFSSPLSDRRIEKFLHTEPSTEGQTTRWPLNWMGARLSQLRQGYFYDLERDFQLNTSYSLFIVPTDKNKIVSDGASSIQDGFGRRLEGTNEISFRFGQPLPRAHVTQTHIVVDSNGNVKPQILLENVEEVRLFYDILDEQGIEQGQIQSVASPVQNDRLHVKFIEMEDSIRSPSGVMSGRVVSRPSIDHPKESIESLFFAQATPYSVFLKLGPAHTLVWVVDLQTGEPIANAAVKFYLGDLRKLAEIEESIFSGETDDDGFVSLPGYEDYDSYLDRAVSGLWRSCPDSRDCPMYFLHVEGKAGIALLPLDFDYTIHGYVRSYDLYNSMDHWATTTQDLYLPGDTVHIKGFIRTRRNDIRVIPDEGHFALCVKGPEGGEFDITPLSLSEFGSYHTSIRLHNNAKLGEYEIFAVINTQEPISKPCHEMDWGLRTFKVLGGSFSVFQFTTNPIRVIQTLNANHYTFGDQMVATTSVQRHADGPYSHATAQVKIRLFPDTPFFQNLHEINFVRSNNQTGTLVNPLFSDEFKVDDAGKHVATINSLSPTVAYGELRVESSVLNDRGKSVTSITKIPYFGTDRFVGIRIPGSAYSYVGHFGSISVGEPWPIEVLVVSKDDEIVVDTEVQITVDAVQFDPNPRQLEKSWSPDYLWNPDIVWKEIFSCKVVSSRDPVSCDFTPLKKNIYKVRARIVDSNGFTQRARLHVEATANPESRSIRYLTKKSTRAVKLDLNCGSQNVNVGDIVRCEIANDIGNSPTLVTIERASVIDHWLVRLNPDNPIIEFTVLEHYGPHFELSVLNQTPLSKTNNSRYPLYRIGTTKFAMDNPRDVPLGITVSSNRDSYEPGDTVELSISIDENKDRKVPTEFAIAVIDETFLALSENGSVFFNPTKKTWKSSKNDVQTYGLIARLFQESDPQSSSSLIPRWDGSLHDVSGYLKSTGPYREPLDPSTRTRLLREADPSIRNVDTFVAYWNPSVIANNGRLKLDFVLPDQLTNWKVLVMAVSAKERFGYAETTFATLKDTEVGPVAPNVVTEGDKFQLGAWILNRTDRRRSLTVEIQTLGNLVEGSPTTYQQQMRFEPFERKLVTWDVEAGIVPPSTDFRYPIKPSEIKIVASAGDRRGSDAIDVRIPVRSSKVRVSSVVHGPLKGEKTTIPISMSSNSVNDTGQLNFTLSTNKAVNFDGVFRHATEYTYSSWEQELSQAVLAMQYVKLAGRGTKHGIQWSDPEALISRVLDSASDYQAHDGGMAYYISSDQLADPYLSAYTAIAFSWFEIAGYIVPGESKERLLGYLRDLLEAEEEVLSDSAYRYDETVINSVQPTVRAVVLHALALWGELKESDLALVSDRINLMDLFGLSHYLMALITIDPKHSMVQMTFERIMNRRFEINGVVEFEESVPMELSHILYSNTRSLCSVLEALTKLSRADAIDLEIGELKELSNTIRYARENSPYWHNTQDNVFCTNAMITFFDYIDSDIDDSMTSVALRSTDTGMSTPLANDWNFTSSIAQRHTQHTLQSHLFGSRGAIEINRQGRGEMFYEVELSYITTVDERINRYSGFELHREYVVYRDKQWYILEPGDEINKGEYVLVNLFLKNRFRRQFVVLDDSVPGGLEPVNANLTTELVLPYSELELRDILAESELYREFKGASLRNFSYREIGLQNVRYFAEGLGRRKYHLLWLGQAISAGEFSVLPARVEEIYQPVMFSKTEPWTLKVNNETRQNTH
ncbi:MAG: hypothetical protein F4W92_00575 [Gammaproteobacteria bacterium]|nr:hypothetical protein [Gammaproteobacteria bacterium]